MSPVDFKKEDAKKLAEWLKQQRTEEQQALFAKFVTLIQTSDGEGIVKSLAKTNDNNTVDVQSVLLGPPLTLLHLIAECSAHNLGGVLTAMVTDTETSMKEMVLFTEVLSEGIMHLTVFNMLAALYSKNVIGENEQGDYVFTETKEGVTLQ